MIVSYTTNWSIIYKHKFTIVNFYSTGHRAEFSTLDVVVLDIPCNDSYYKTGQLKVENSAQTNFKFSPNSFHAPLTRYNVNTYNDFTYNDFTYNDFTHDDNNF